MATIIPAMNKSASKICTNLSSELFKKLLENRFIIRYLIKLNEFPLQPYDFRLIRRIKVYFFRSVSGTKIFLIGSPINHTTM